MGEPIRRNSLTMTWDSRATSDEIAKAVGPFGLVVHVQSQSDRVGVADLRLKSSSQPEGELVGFVGWHSSGHVAMLIYETKWVWRLEKPITLDFESPSAAQIYERLNEEIMKRLRRRPIRVRKAAARAKFRQMLCVQTDHDDPWTSHSFQGSDDLNHLETWRCAECGHDSIIPTRSRAART